MELVGKAVAASETLVGARQGNGRRGRQGNDWTGTTRLGEDMSGRLGNQWFGIGDAELRG